MADTDLMARDDQVLLAGADEGRDLASCRREPLRLVEAASVARLTDVSLRLQGRQILAGVNLDLKPASIMVLLGVNGAGKTTLMRTLSGRTRPDRGRVTILGRDPRRDAGIRRAVGWVPQSVALYPALTVRENLVAFAALGRREGRSPERVADVLEAVGMTTMAEHRVGDLSGGFQRRVNLAAALVSGPSLLLLDEPTVGLDLAAKQAVVDIVTSVARSGTAILLATHDFDVAAAGDRVGFLARGSIIAEGRPRDLLDQHFATRVRLRLQTGQPADPVLATALRAAGLLAALGDTWGAPAQGLTQEQVDGALAAVAAGRCPIRSLSVESPGLKDLYDLLLTRAA